MALTTTLILESQCLSNLHCEGELSKETRLLTTQGKADNFFRCSNNSQTPCQHRRGSRQCLQQFCTCSNSGHGRRKRVRRSYDMTWRAVEAGTSGGSAKSRREPDDGLSLRRPSLANRLNLCGKRLLLLYVTVCYSHSGKLEVLLGLVPLKECCNSENHPRKDLPNLSFVCRMAE